MITTSMSRLLAVGGWQSSVLTVLIPGGNLPKKTNKQTNKQKQRQNKLGESANVRLGEVQNAQPKKFLKKKGNTSNHFLWKTYPFVGAHGSVIELVGRTRLGSSIVAIVSYTSPVSKILSIAKLGLVLVRVMGIRLDSLDLNVGGGFV
jgi:hypothetical protein